MLWLPPQCFSGIPECANDWVSVSVSVSHVFPWVLFLSFVLSYSVVLVFALSYYLFYYYSLEACLFSDERQKGVDLDWEGCGEEL